MKNLNSLITALLLVMVLLPVQAYASDLEVYQGGGTDAKVLLVLDASGSMLLEDSVAGGQVFDYSETRMNTLFEALTEVLEDDEIYSNPDLAVGLSYFGGVTGSGIKFPAAPLSTPASVLIPEAPADMSVKDVILNMVDGIFPRDEEIYSPAPIDLKASGYYNEKTGEVRMKNVPSCDSLIADQDWSLTAGNEPDLWENNYEELDLEEPLSSTAGSKWSESETPNNMPMSWMQVCPEPPSFSSDVTVQVYKKDDDGNLIYPLAPRDEVVRVDECDMSGNYWDPDECKLEGWGAIIGVETTPIDGWPEGGHPGEWGSCQPDADEIEKLAQVSACATTFFTLYNDTRQLYTPTVDALFEAQRYFSGDKVYYGARDHFPEWNTTLPASSQRYVDLPEVVADFPVGDPGDVDYPEVREYLHGFPGNLEVLGIADKRVYVSNERDFNSIETGGLWGWRAANPLTYEDDDGGNDGPRRNYIKKDSWNDGLDLLTNDVFRYDCDYRIGRTVSKGSTSYPEQMYDQWSYLFNSWYGCNIVEVDTLLAAYPQTIDAVALQRVRDDDDDVDAMGNENNISDKTTPTSTRGPEGSEYLDCQYHFEDSTYCPVSSSDGENLEVFLETGKCPVEEKGSSHWERRCEFRFESAKSYVSPIGECSNSSIILVTDGHPTANTVDNSNYNYVPDSIGSETDPAIRMDNIFPGDVRTYNVRQDTPGLIRDLTGLASCAPIFTGLSPMSTSSTIELLVKHEINKSGVCGKELVKYMSENSQRPETTSAKGRVTTHTIGFQLPATDPAVTFLEDIAEAGGGQYETAGNKEALVTAIKNMISSASKDSSDTSSVAVSLDSNTLTSAKEAYAPVFKSTKNNIWDANIKGYYLYAKPDTIEEDMLLGEGVRSFWSDDSAYIGNKKVLAGGLNKVIMPTITYNSMLSDDTDISSNRSKWAYPDHSTLGRANKVYAERKEWDVEKLDRLIDLQPKDFGWPNNSAANEDKKDELLDFIMAQPLGDSLHTKPVSIEYNDNKYLVVVSNAGFLHTFKLIPNVAANGDIDYHTNEPEELTAWIPHSLVPNLRKQKNNVTNSGHVYGLDSPLRIWSPTVEVDGVSVKKTFAFFGMRRGGSSYYMLDLSNPELPTVVWRIDSGDADFQVLGESWSPITLFKVNDTNSEVTLDVSGEQKLHGLDDTYVAVFGGGYRNKFEDNAELTRDEIQDKLGRGLYVINPLTGELLRSFGNATEKFSEDVNEMKWGVPAEIRAIDVDGNGYGDRLYFGDMGGQLWRVDLDASEDLTSQSAYYVKLLADFGGNLESSVDDGDTEEQVAIDDMRNHRRFYTTPAVAFSNDGDLAIAIGSGYRAHPLQGSASDEAAGPAIEDRFYLLKDTSMSLNNPANTSVLPVDTSNSKTEVDLYDATDNLAGDLSTRATALAAISDADGWYIQLKESSGFVGEKVLSTPVIFRNTISFTTTTPRGASGACVYTPTLNRFYSINMFDATPSGLLTEVDPSDPDAVIPITGSRSVDIDTDDAIVDEVQVVTMDAESAGYQDVDGSSGSTDTGDGDSEQEVCAKVFAKQTEMMKMCYAPTKVFWKETGRAEVDCRFDDVAACNDVSVAEETIE